MTEYRYEFNVWEAAEALDGDRIDGASRNEDDDFRGCSLEEAREYVRGGWDAGAAEIGARNPNFRVEEVPSFEYALAEDGSEVDVAAWLSGEPMHMGDWRAVPMPKPFVKIGVDVGANCNVSTSSMLRVGRSVLSCVEQLRAMGYPTQIDAVWGISGSGGNRCEIKIRVQESDQPIHGSLLAFFIAHPAALRRVMFALGETLPMDVRRRFGFVRGSGYGMSGPSIWKNEYDEWAPSAERGEAAATQWVADVIGRRSQ